MPLNVHHTNWLTGSYKGDLYFLLKVAENDALRNNPSNLEYLRPHLDSKNRVAIGYGYDLAANRGIPAGQTKTQARLDLEFAGVTVGSEADSIIKTLTGSTTAMVREQLSAVLVLPSEAVASELLRIAIERRVGAFVDSLGSKGIVLPESRERAVLFSMWYQGQEKYFGTVAKPSNLTKALMEGDRAEVWYEIRYGSSKNGRDGNGVVVRRFAESELFGLYDNELEVTSNQAMQVFRMLQRHRAKMQDYESRLGTQLGKANSVYGLSGSDAVQPLSVSLEPAKLALVAEINARYVDLPATLNTIVSTDIYIKPVADPDHGGIVDARVYDGNGRERSVNNLVLGESGNDLLLGGLGDDFIFGGNGNDELHGHDGNNVMYGESGQDVLYGGDHTDTLHGGAGADNLQGFAGKDQLYGGDGDDILIGGQGDDVLVGGEGFDTYVYRTGDGNDRIVDADMRGRIIIDDGIAQTLVPSLFIETTPGSGVWQSPDRTLTLTHHSPWQLILQDGSTIELGLDFKDGDFGIRLTDAVPPLALPSSVIVGDLSPVDFDSTAPGVQAQYDSFGNVVTDPKVPDPERADTLYGSADDDRISGFLGLDRLEGKDGDDVLEGGGGRDVIAGGAGTDTLFAGDWVDVSGLTDYRNYGGETTDGAYGDFLTAGPGDDILVGETQADALMGGEGDDLLIGGAGHDVLFGDATYQAQGIDWTVRGLPEAYPAADETSPGWGNGVGLSPVVGSVDTVAGGSDRIYGGSGGDWILAGKGGDLVFGEGGMDSIDGGADDDVLYGGEDDDVITGDLRANPREHGDDFVDLGGGKLQQFASGGGGSDVILGGETPDLLEGDDIRQGYAMDYHGADYIDGKGGDDTIYGEGRADTIFGGDGNDLIRGDSSTDQIPAPYQGDDAIDGGAGDDQVAGDGGNDVINGGDGNDILYGDNTDVDVSVHGDDRIYGDTGADLIFGQNGNDVLFGGAGKDELQGGEGDDSLDGGPDDDLLFGEAGDDTLWGGDGDDELQGNEGSDQLLGGAGGDRLFGQAGDDLLEGGDGADVLVGDVGNDTLSGGAGRDTYVYHLGNGTDRIEDFAEMGAGGKPIGNILRFGAGIGQGDISLGLGSLLISLPDGGAIHVEGFEPDNPDANPVIDTFVFADGTTLSHGQIMSRGFDVVGTPQADTLEGTSTDDRVLALEGDDTIFAGAGADRLDGGAGNDLLDGGSGNDWMAGGVGDDIYVVDDAADILVEQAGGGNDTVETGLDAYALGDNIENLQLLGVATSGIGNHLANRLQGNGVDNRLIGAAGDDMLDGAGGDDTLEGGTDNDSYVFGAGYGEDIVIDTAGASDCVMIADALTVADITLARSGNDVIIGLKQASDRMILKDWYLPDNRIESIRFPDGSLLDVAAIEQFIVGSSLDVRDDTAWVGEDVAPIVGGNVLANDGDLASAGRLVVTNPGQYDGAYGRLILTEDGHYTFELNNDSPLVQSLGQDQIVEDSFVYSVAEKAPSNSREGVATLKIVIAGRNDAPFVSNPIPDQIGLENHPVQFVLAGDTFADVDQDNDLFLSANLANSDPLPAWLTFDNTFRRFQGTPTDGTAGVFDIKVTAIDRAGSSVSDVFTLTVDPGVKPGMNLKGSPGRDVLRGSDYDDWIEGLGSRDWLYGRAGDDTLKGGCGNDRLEGGKGADWLLGESGSDRLLANDGNDLLDGGSGRDVMIGGSGDDTYIVDSRCDQIFEHGNSGMDTVRSTVHYKLSANLENLTLTGKSAIDGAGNALDNVLIGNDAANTLKGGSGNDVLDGGAGRDILLGGHGNDRYRVGHGSNADSVLDFDVTCGNTDVLSFGTGITADQIWFRQVGANLEASVIGTGDRITIMKWYDGPAYHVEQFQTADGKTLLDAQVDNLVAAMAAFSPPAAGQALLPQNYQDHLETTLAANWK